ncbi:uncharacterized protein LOC144349524, partial [Saccoglossus kowalevskii]
NIGNLSQLVVLHLHHNNLRTIPDNIGNLSQLEYLSLYGNPLIDLPVSLRRLKNLEVFTCDVIDGILEQDVRIWSNKTKIRKLFDKVFKRKGGGLRYFAKNCGLSKFPSEVFDESRRNVEVIYLQGNNISEIPENISCLRHLKELWLSYNNLRTIPDNIGNLSQLEDLTLDGNPLIDLPVSLRRLKNLEYFTCDVIDGILEQDVRISDNKTEIRKLFDKVFKKKVNTNKQINKQIQVNNKQKLST